MTTSKSVVIVGSGLAGCTLARQLGTLGYPGSVTLVGEETHAPYDRPPLSKQFQLDGNEQAIALQPPGESVRVLAGRSAKAIHTDTQELELENGERLSWDSLVLATGTRPRLLPGVATSRHVMTLRTLDDAKAIRSELREGSRLAVIGGGPIGLELAATAQQRGAQVTVIEAADRLMARSAPPTVAALLLDWHRAQGVTVELQAKVQSVADGTICLTDGRSIEADLIVVGIGVIANDELARKAGLATDDGIFVDALARTTHPGIYAIGDVTRQCNPVNGRYERIETWSNAQGQAMSLAHRIAGSAQAKPYADVPWFWSDQGKLRLQCAGLIQGEVQASRGDIATGWLLAQWYAGRLVGIAAINTPRDFNMLRRLIGTEANITPEQFTEATDIRKLVQQAQTPAS